MQRVAILPATLPMVSASMENVNATMDGPARHAMSCNATPDACNTDPAWKVLAYAITDGMETYAPLVCYRIYILLFYSSN